MLPTPKAILLRLKGILRNHMYVVIIDMACPVLINQ